MATVESKLEQPINSMEELANSKDVQLVLQYRTELTDRFLVSEIKCEFFAFELV